MWFKGALELLERVPNNKKLTLNLVNRVALIHESPDGVDLAHDRRRIEPL